MAQSNRPEVEELRNKARARDNKKAACYQRVFTSPDGKVVLDDLAAEFRLSEMHVKGDSYATHVRVGEFRVLQYIQAVMEVDTDELQ